MKLSDIKKLETKKFRRQFGAIFLEGERFVSEAENSPFKRCEVVASQENIKSRFKVRYVTDQEYAKLSSVQTPQGIGVLINTTEFQSIEKTSRAVFLDDVQDPGNLGTIIRTLAWFGNYTLYLSGGCADPFNPKVLRSAAGGHFYVPIVENADFHETRYQFDECYLLDLNGKNMSQLKTAESHLLVFGNEAHGISDDIRGLADCERFRIMGANHIESLNVASAASMTLFHVNK